MKEKNQNQKSIKQTNNKTASPGDDVAVALVNSQQLWVPAHGQACLKSRQFKFLRGLDKGP